MQSVELHVAMRDRGVWRQMVEVSRDAFGNEGQRSREADGWLKSVEMHVAMRDRGAWRQMVEVSRVESDNEKQRSLETDG